MVDIASLAIQIDTSDVSRAERDLDRLSSKGTKSERAAKGVGDAHDKATSKVGALGTSARKTGDALDKGARSAGAYAGKIAAMAAPLLSVAAALAAINKVSDVQRQFDVLNAGLVTATGSAKNAQVAFSALQDFARQTPYDLAQAVEGFTKLVNLGLTPSEKALRSYGNTASALGKDLNQMIEAVADASTGEFERLKEFGIKAKQNGDQVSLTFQGVTKSIGNNAAEIEKYLTDLGENQFAGAMLQRMATLDGAISNLGDSWDSLARNISNAGAGDLMEAAVRQAEKIEDTIDSVKRAFESADVELAGSREAYRAMVEDIDLTTQAGQEMFATLMALSGQAAQYYSILEQQAAQAYAALQANVAVYYEQFTTAGEKADDMLASVTASFEALELALPSSRDGFRAVVDGLDTSTEAGQRMFETLMSVAGAADAYYDILESRAAEAQAAAEQALSAGYLAAVSVAQNAFGKMQESVAAERRALDDEYTAKLDVINAARDAVGSAIGRLRTAVEAEQDRLRAEQEAALDRVSELADLSDSLRSGLRAMRLESEQFDRMRRDQARGQLSSALNLARSGGSLQGLDLSDALSELSNSDTSGFASFEEYARDYWRTANDINELAGLTDAQLSVDEQIAKSLEEQSASLGEMLAAAQSQYDALLGIDNAVLAVGDAVALFESSLVTAQQTASDAEIERLTQQHDESTAYFDQMLSDAQRQMDILQGIDSSVLSVGRALANFRKANEVATNTPKTNSQAVASAYVKVLGRSAEADGLQFWTEQLNSGAVTQAGLKDAIAQGALNFDAGSYTGPSSLADIEASKKAAAKYLGIPGFAAGGFHSGGLRLVGEDGPELEVTGPSRIYNASQTAAMLGGGGGQAATVAELRALRGEMQSSFEFIGRHIKAVSDNTDTMANSGVQVVGTVETKAVA